MLWFFFVVFFLLFFSCHRYLDEILHNFELITVLLRAFILFLKVQTVLKCGNICVGRTKCPKVFGVF